MRFHTAGELGQVIRARRRELGLTQAQLAGAIGASRKWVVALEGSGRANDLELLLRAMNALGLDLEVRTRLPARGTATDIDSIVDASRQPR
ncbi:MAG TPA: helix-turn-helix domain-containing protein [Gemmatimonadales bacterium]